MAQNGFKVKWNTKIKIQSLILKGQNFKNICLNYVVYLNANQKKKAVVFKEKLYNTNNKNLVVTIQLLTSDYNKSDTNCANLEKKKTV